MQPLATDNALVDGHRIAHGVVGTGQPVILIHGTPSSSLIWRNIVPKLVESDHKVCLYDLLGYGLSERPWSSSVDASISGQVSVLEGMLQHWGLAESSSRFHIIAHDIGGAVAQRFAILSPHHNSVLSLSLIDSVSYDSYPSERTLQMLESGIETLIKAPDNAHRAHYRDWLLSAVVNKEKFTNGSLPTYLDYISGPIGQGSLFQHQIMHYNPKHTLEIAERYHELGRVPVKLVWGKQDEWQVTSWAEKLCDAIPGASLEVVEEAGHFSLEDQPDRVAEILVRHLQQSPQKQ